MLVWLRITMKSVLTVQSVLKLMIPRETMRFWKVGQILGYHVPNNLLSAEKFVDNVLLLLYQYRYETELLLSFPSLYQTAKARISGCCKDKQYKVWNNETKILLIRLFLNLIRPWLTIKVHITKLKWWNTRSRISQWNWFRRFLQFSTVCYKYYQIMKLQKV